MTYKIETVIKNIKNTLIEKNLLTNNKAKFNQYLKAFINETNIISRKKQKIWYNTFIELGYIKRIDDYILFI